MEKLPLPEKCEIKKISSLQADFVIEPCYPGYGTTVGNSLRRVLLSSLPGAAITAVKIKGASHEFSTLPGVKEDIVNILLNLKKIRFNLHGVDETKTNIKVKGEKIVTAKEIKATSEIEIVTPDAHIATLTSKDAEFEAELILSTGRGYVPVENLEKKKYPLGTIAIDAIFTPIRNVNYKVENVRVGQMTNYDKLILSVTTDGSISPEEAVAYSASILVDHFNFITAISHGKETETGSTKKSTEKNETIDTVSIDNQQKEQGTKKEITEKPKKKRGRPKKET